MSERERPGRWSGCGCCWRTGGTCAPGLAPLKRAHDRRAGRLGLAGLVASIPGVSALAGALILAESGDPRRFSSARALVKHAGLNPAERTSATINGQSRVSRRGRPGLRAAAWRAAWGAMPHNAVLAARHARLAGRDKRPLADGQARSACAATLLRWIWAVTATGGHGTPPSRPAGPLVIAENNADIVIAINNWITGVLGSSGQ